MRVLTAEELRRVIEWPDRDTPTGCRNAIALMLMGWAGLTPQELSAIEVEHVDLQAGSVQVSGGERVSARTLGLHAECQQLIRGWLSVDARPERPDARWLLPAIARPHRGNQQDPSYWSRMAAREAEAAGLDDVTATVLRHTFAVIAANDAEAGWSDRQLAYMLGCSIDHARSFRAFDAEGVVVRMQQPGPQPRLEDAGGPEIRRIRERTAALEEQFEQMREQVERLQGQREEMQEHVERLTADVNVRLANAHERMDAIAEAQGELHEENFRVLAAGGQRTANGDGGLTPSVPLSTRGAGLREEGEGTADGGGRQAGSLPRVEEGESE